MTELLVVEVVEIVCIVVVAVAWWRVDQRAEWFTVSGRFRGINQYWHFEFLVVVFGIRSAVSGKCRWSR